MLAKGEEPERRSFPALACAVAEELARMRCSRFRDGCAGRAARLLRPATRAEALAEAAAGTRLADSLLHVVRQDASSQHADHRRLDRRCFAQGPLRPRAHHHHRAHRRARRRRRLRVHGAALAGGDAAPVGSDSARHRGASSTSTRTIRGKDEYSAAHRDGARPAQPVDAGAAARRPAGAAAEAVLRAARPGAVGRDPPAGATAVLDRHRRPVAPRGDPRQARERHPALRRHALADVRVELAHLPVVDDRLVGDPAHRRHSVPAQPDPADPAARRGGRRLRQRAPRARRLPPARRARGAAGGDGVPRDARPHHDARRAAHHHARRRQPRPAHHPDPLQAGAGAARRYARGAVAAGGRARDAGHARGLSRVRQGRRRRGVRADQFARAARGGARSRRSTSARRSSSRCASGARTSCCR